jgi:hypothetical protein
MRDSKLLVLLQKMSDKELQNLYDLVSNRLILTKKPM